LAESRIAVLELVWSVVVDWFAGMVKRTECHPFSPPTAVTALGLIARESSHAYQAPPPFTQTSCSYPVI